VSNYFDEQRFSQDNWRIGAALLARRFDVALRLVTAHRGAAEGEVAAAAAAGMAPLEALLRLPRKTLLLYLHAYQSHLFNRVLADEILRGAGDAHDMWEIAEGPLRFPHASPPQGQAPLPGFGSDLGSFGPAVDALLAEEGLTLRSFVVPQLPNLSLEGTWRAMAFSVSDPQCGPVEPDEYSSGHKCAVRFVLAPGSYATLVIKAWALRQTPSAT
jgi:tRNA(Glu) U13 pseudouridine synthase TruD